MSGVFYFINPEDNIPYFMTGTTDVVFSPLPRNAMVYTLRNPLANFSFTFEGNVVPLFVSTQKDLTFRDILVFWRHQPQTDFGPMVTPNDLDNAVNGIRYQRAMTDCDGLLLGEDRFIQYLQFPNSTILFSLSSTSPEVIAANLINRNEVYEGKVNPAKGQVKTDITNTLDPIIKVSIYLLVVIAIFLLFLLMRSTK